MLSEMYQIICSIKILRTHTDYYCLVGRREDIFTYILLDTGLELNVKFIECLYLATANCSCCNQLHGAEPLLRGCQLCGHSRTSQHCMELEG
jgi:hypothetical protein